MELGSIVGPVAEWELRMLARRGRYFVIRTIFASYLLVCLALAVEHERALLGSGGWGSAAARLAESLFNAMAAGQLVAVALVTPGYMAAAIAGRRERRTLDELYATDLSDGDIVIGVWLARMLQALSLLVAGLPMFAILSLLGGIDGVRIIANLLLCLGVTASTAALGVGFSVRENTVREAFAAAYTYAAVAWILLLGFGALIPVVGHDEMMVMVFFFLFVNAIATALLLFWSVANLRRDESAESAPIAAAQIPEVPALPAIGDHPVFWKEWHLLEGRRRSKTAVAFSFLFVLELLLLMIGFFGVDNDPQAKRERIGVFVTAIVLFLYIVFAVRLASSFGVERDRDSWDSLLGTTLIGRELINGKIMGGLRIFCWLPLLLSPFWFAGLSGGTLSWFTIPAFLFVFGCHIVFIVGVAVLASLSARSSMSAVIRTIGALVITTLLADLLIRPVLTGDFRVEASLWLSLHYIHLPASLTNESLTTLVSYLAASLVFGILGLLGWLQSIIRFDQMAGRSSNHRSIAALDTNNRFDDRAGAIFFSRAIR